MALVFNPITAQFETSCSGGGAGGGSSIIVGTEDGTLVGTQYPFVNNIFKQILAAGDRIDQYVYADAGTRNERIIEISTTSGTVHSGMTAKRTITYSLVGSSYIFASISRSVI